MLPGDICLAHFPFGDVPGMKLRPVLVLTQPVGAIPEVLVAYVSSVVPKNALPSDLLIDPQRPEHAGTKLRTISVLRLHKLATIHARSVVRRLGTLSPAMTEQVKHALRLLLDL